MFLSCQENFQMKSREGINGAKLHCIGCEMSQPMNIVDKYVISIQFTPLFYKHAQYTVGILAVCGIMEGTAKTKDTDNKKQKMLIKDVSEFTLDNNITTEVKDKLTKLCCFPSIHF